MLHYSVFLTGCQLSQYTNLYLEGTKLFAFKPVSNSVVTTCLEMLTDESVIEETDMKGFWRNLSLRCFDGSIYILTIGRLSWVEACQVLYRSMIFVQKNNQHSKAFQMLYVFLYKVSPKRKKKKPNQNKQQNSKQNQTNKEKTTLKKTQTNKHLRLHRCWTI